MSPSRTTRRSAEGRAYLDLQNLARRTGRLTEELHQFYVLECFLDRLVRSPYADRFVLKGGVLLAAYDTRRPTRDIDLRGRNVDGEPEAVRVLIAEIASADLGDGVVFDTASTRVEIIRDEDEYQGVRVVMGATLATARMVFHVDVNVGDPVVPPERSVELPRLLGGMLRIAGYPLAMVHAEKILTAVERGTANTRWRDFADIATLAVHHDIGRRHPHLAGRSHVSRLRSGSHCGSPPDRNRADGAGPTQTTEQSISASVEGDH